MTKRIVAICILSLSAFSSVAHADDPRVRATADFNEGMELRSSGKKEAALEKLKSAHAAYPTAITGLELGRTYMLLGKLRDARDAFLTVSKIGPRANESARANNARAESAALAVEIASRIPKLRFRHVGEAPRVNVDGVAVADVDAIVELDPGAHDVEVIRGENHDRKHVTLEEGKSDVVDLGGTAPIIDTPPVVVQSTAKSRVPFWIGVSITGAAAIFGGVSGGVALANANTASPKCVNNVCDPSVASNVDAAKTWSTVSTISFITAGVLAIGTIVIFFVTSGSKSPATISAPALGLATAAHVGTLGFAF